jgi:nitrogen regulatory protein PII
MEDNLVRNNFEVACVIVNYGQGSKVLKTAKHNGILGGTIILGRGTVKNHLLEFLELTDIRKEIVLMIADREIIHDAVDKIDKEFKFHKPYHGIAFTSSVPLFLGTGNYEYKSGINNGGLNKSMYNSIFVIVDKGKGEQVMEAATKAGARGGTIINGRGSGIHETSKLFHMDIEPEKEIVMILSENSITEGIVTSIRDQLQIDKPGNGIIFVQEINKTYGVLA